tara:strand:+ start:12955 stop:13209 length:255 start_codon:yes stop_codon:yes gene_type:complete
MKKTKLITEEMKDIILNGTPEEQIELHFDYGDNTYCYHAKSLEEDTILIWAEHIRKGRESRGFTYSNKARTFRVGKYFTLWRGI